MFNLSNMFLGVRIWIWLYFLFSVVAGLGVIIYWKREQIKRIYYEIRYPEKLLKIVIHYPSSLFKVYWRLIPDHEDMNIAGMNYKYDKDSVIKRQDFFAKLSKNDYKVVIEGKTYTVNDIYKISKRSKKFPELHYYYNSPMPLCFNFDTKVLEFSSKQLEEFKQNDLFGKLLTLDTERNKLTIVMLVVIVNLLCTFALVAIEMGWIQTK